MKLTVIADAAGNILGTAYASSEKAEKGKEAPAHFGLVAQAGQVLLEVDAPADVAQLPAHEFLERFRLEVAPSEAKLVKAR